MLLPVRVSGMILDVISVVELFDELLASRVRLYGPWAGLRVTGLAAVARLNLGSVDPLTALSLSRR